MEIGFGIGSGHLDRKTDSNDTEIAIESEEAQTKQRKNLSILYFCRSCHAQRSFAHNNAVVFRTKMDAKDIYFLENSFIVRQIHLDPSRSFSQWTMYCACRRCTKFTELGRYTTNFIENNRTLVVQKQIQTGAVGGNPFNCETTSRRKLVNKKALIRPRVWCHKRRY